MLDPGTVALNSAEPAEPVVNGNEAATGLAAARDDLIKPESPLPYVSVVIPCRNEGKHISAVLEGLASQYDPQHYELIVVDGMSSDSTRQQVTDFIAQHPELKVRLVDNPERHIPIALNRGIAAAGGEIIVRMDGHTIPPHDYVRRCVRALEDHAVAVVGMPWQIVAGEATNRATAIALALSHPFAVGDARYRSPETGAAQLVDTVPFGCYRKSLWARLGGYNESLLSNEDYDFNYRVRQNGGAVLLDRSMHCTYVARSTYSQVIRQYYRYGEWKVEMLKLHPRSLRLRQISAPCFVLFLLVFTPLEFWSRTASWLLLGTLSLYLTLAAASAAHLATRKNQISLVPSICLAFLLIHLSWGTGFIARALGSLAGRKLE